MVKHSEPHNTGTGSTLNWLGLQAEESGGRAQTVLRMVSRPPNTQRPLHAPMHALEEDGWE